MQQGCFGRKPSRCKGLDGLEWCGETEAVGFGKRAFSGTC